ncbi:MAG TPA: prepilin-type N-terminal cleavage/methylation domain-containing protein [Vicinamibacterales bacterium]|nr:prepilin-type N-terminal cleavage/methylation domain-containing protein [Vicinamibacterales bacterium]
MRVSIRREWQDRRRGRVPLDDSHEAAMNNEGGVQSAELGLPRAKHPFAPTNGFTLVELLVAMTITLLIAGALAGVAQPAREAFDRVPAELDLQQRGRTAIDALSQALRSSGKNVAATDLLGSLSDLLPTAFVSRPNGSGSFAELTVIAPVRDAAQGVLFADQAGAAAPITLATTHCPNVKDVCGFTPGATVLIADGSGHSDVFSVASTNAGARRLSPARALSRSYPVGSAVIEVDQSTFSLARQTDGSDSLIRRTAAGAVQPIVDFVTGLSFDVIGRDAAAGFFQLEQVDVVIGVEPPTELLRRLMTGRIFRTSIRLRNAS